MSCDCVGTGSKKKSRQKHRDRWAVAGPLRNEVREAGSEHLGWVADPERDSCGV
jgi:hypothetical protein